MMIGAVAACHIVNKQDSCLARHKVLLKRKHLPPVSQRILGKETQFRQAVKHHTLRLNPLDFRLDQLDGATKLDLPGMKDRLILPVSELLVRPITTSPRNCSAADSSKSVMPSRLQPCESATLVNSSAVSDSVM